jgi:hypothetical protein
MAYDRLTYNREYAREHRAEMVARTRAWRKANPEKARESSYKWRRENPEKALLSKRRTYYRRVYGLELEEIEATIAAQGGVCPICSIELKFGGKNGAHVDHDHKSGRIRGITCCNCNTGLGQFKENPEFLWQAIRYLIDGQEIT